MTIKQNKSWWQLKFFCWNQKFWSSLEVERAQFFSSPSWAWVLSTDEPSQIFLKPALSLSFFTNKTIKFKLKIRLVEPQALSLFTASQKLGPGLRARAQARSTSSQIRKERNLAIRKKLEEEKPRPRKSETFWPQKPQKVDDVTKNHSTGCWSFASHNLEVL